MTARIKSSVLRREERGLGNITMGRLIASGMGGGIFFMLMRVLGLSVFMIPGGLAAFIMALILTNPRHGIPLYIHLYITLRARLLISAVADDTSPSAKIASFIDLNPEQLLLDASQLLSAPVLVEDFGTLDDWEIIPDSDDLAGFEVVTDTILLEATL